MILPPLAAPRSARGGDSQARSLPRVSSHAATRNPACILLLTSLVYDDPTFRVVLESLAASYHERGYEVITAGQAAPWSKRQIVVQRAPWGEIRRLGGTAPGGLERAEATLSELMALLPRVDLAHLHFTGNLSEIVGAIGLACRETRVPLGVTFQGYGHQIPPRPRSPGEIAFLEEFLSKCGWVTALSRFNARAIERDVAPMKGRVHVIPNGFDPARAACGEKQPARGGGARRLIAAIKRRNRPFILCVARLMRYKGIDILLMAWKDVCGRIGDVDLLICGPDFERGYYQGLVRRLGVSSRVRFSGPADHGEVLNLMRRCLFFVLPSRHESFGIAALEAMACGRAVLATRSGGVEEFLQDGESGLLTPPMDVDALRDGLLRLLGEPRLRRRLGGGARRAAKAYGWGRIAGRYLSLARMPAQART